MTAASRPRRPKIAPRFLANPVGSSTHPAPPIGIGGAVTCAPLPHHPACGSRTGRFEKLWLRGQSGDPKLVEVASGQSAIEQELGVVPPATAVGRHGTGIRRRHTACVQLTVDHSAMPPLLQM